MWVELQNGTVILENSLAVAQKVHLGIYDNRNENTNPYKNLYTHVHSTIICNSTKRGTQCLSTD